MENYLTPYNGINEISQLMLSEVPASSNPVAKIIGDFMSELARPITDLKRLDKLETTIIACGRQNAEVKKEAIKRLGQALDSGRLSPEAQIKAIETIERMTT